MADVVAGQLQCTIVTPERQIVDEAADFVVFTAHDGQFGILPEHSPLLCKLGPGLLRIDNNHKKQYFFVAGGFAEVLDNRITVLTPQAIPAEKLETGIVNKELIEAENLPTKTEEDRQKRQKSLQFVRGKQSTMLAFQKKE
ncbi:MAG: ATP synthase F1 subunit epsilon [Phycisphaerae bacterium]